MIAAIVLTVLFAALVAFQLALAAGVPWGRAAYGGSVDRLGTRFRVASVVAALIWSAAAVIVLGRGGVIEVPISGILIWVVVILCALGIVANAITRSRIERAIWLPFSLIVTTLGVVVAFN